MLESLGMKHNCMACITGRFVKFKGLLLTPSWVSIVFCLGCNVASSDICHNDDACGSCEACIDGVCVAQPQNEACGVRDNDSSSEGFVAATASDGELDSEPSSVVITAVGAIDGAASYAKNCGDCHGPIDAIVMMPVEKRNVPDIRTAIVENTGGMNTPSLNALSDEELQAIVDAMAAANP